jgi:two-component system, NtrC family, nitrogen regulation response regulator NtrX
VAHDILIIDDEADIRSLVGGILRDEGYATREAKDSETAFEAIRAQIPTLIILDIWLQGSRKDGMEILAVIKREHPNLPIVMISGHGTIEAAVQAIKLGAYDFVEKPFKADRLLHVVERAIEAARLKQENAELRLRIGTEYELLGESPSIAQLRGAIQRVGPTGSRVLITGPAGAGKEVAARALHSLSRRADAPFTVLNCATMSPERVEVELFGAEETGKNRSVGILERAHRGTLLLDEVADLPLETQGKIVRALQDESFMRVGGSARIEVDVRVIASTNRDLKFEIENGRFREDLYYRLAVVPLQVPALKERREDIPSLATYFMRRSSELAGVPARQLGEDVIAALQSYDWPGNVRQLRNVIEWLLIMAPGEPRAPIRAEMLPPEIGSVTPAMLRNERSGEIMAMPLREAREIFEREYLMAQINRFGGNISRTASFVGMERSALHRKLKTLGVHGTERGVDFTE